LFLAEKVMVAVQAHLFQVYPYFFNAPCYTVKTVPKRNQCRAHLVAPLYKRFWFLFDERRAIHTGAKVFSNFSRARAANIKQSNKEQANALRRLPALCRRTSTLV
jgi:hypothetical protein